MKYKYIINFFYEDCGYEIPNTRMAKTIEDAYNYLCELYQQINPQIDFYEEYPLDKVKNEIEKYGYSGFIGNDDIETVDFYIKFNKSRLNKTTFTQKCAK